MSKFYKENDSSWNICGMTYPSATCKLSWIDIDDMIVTSIYDSKNVVYKGSVSGLSRKDGAAYIDKDDFINSTVEFFIKPVGGGGSSGVSSVNNRTGAVVLDKNDVGLNNVENLSITSEISKIPIATQISNGLMSAEDKKKLDTGGAGSGVTSINGRKGDVSLSSSDVGLEKCNNTSDSEKPISESQRKRFKGIGRASLDGFSETPEEMRLKIPESDRIRGFMLTRSTNAGVLTEMYKSSTTIDKNWSDSNNWSTVFTNEDKNVANGYAGLDAARKLANDVIRTDFRMSQGYIFDGVNDYLSIAHNDKLNFGTDDFSIQCCFTTSPSSRDERIFAKHNKDSAAAGISLRKDAGNNLLTLRVFDGVNKATIPLKKYIMAKENISFFCTRTNSLVKVYINGVIDTIYQLPSAGSVNSTEPLTLGAVSNDYLSGYLSLFRLFNRALSQSDVTYYENNGRPDLQRLKYEDVITNYGELIPNGFSSSVGWYNPHNVLFEDNKAKFVNKTNANYISKQIVAPLKRYRYKVRVESINIGTSLSIGALGATFTDVGIKVGETVGQTINPHFAISILGAGSLNAILDSISVVQVGCVLELLPENALPDRWLESQNGLDAITFGSPAINTETPITDMQIVDNITNNIATGVTNRDYTLPAGYIVDSVCVNSTVALTALQLVNITTTETLLTGKTVSATANKHLPITADQSSSRVDSTIRLNCVGNTGLGFNIVINIKKCL